MPLGPLTEMFQTLAPAGFYAALRVNYAFPAFEINKLPCEWVETYSRRGLVVHDPVMRWIYANSGILRWDELALPDPEQVLDLAQSVGLRYGLTISINRPCDKGQRSYASLFRADREFTPLEIGRAELTLLAAHEEAGAPSGITPASLEALRLKAQGMRLKQIAAHLGISDSAVKARLLSAQQKLGAKTAAEVLAIAAARRLL